MSGTYAGSPTALNTLIGLVQDSDEPTGALYSAPLEQLADRTAGLVPDIQTFTSSGTWTKPANALWCKFVLVGGGVFGGGGSGSFGGQGGGAGLIVEREIPSSAVPASLTVTVGVAGLFAGPVQPTASQVTDGANFNLLAARGASAGSPPANPAAGNPGVINNGGGAAGAGGNGSLGNGGGAGQGAGAGGGGGGAGGGIGSSAGGNGGDGGYAVPGATAATAGVNGGASSGNGGNGAPGVVVITTWRKPL